MPPVLHLMRWITTAHDNQALGVYLPCAHYQVKKLLDGNSSAKLFFDPAEDLEFHDTSDSTTVSQLRKRMLEKT